MKKGILNYGQYLSGVIKYLQAFVEENDRKD